MMPVFPIPTDWDGTDWACVIIEWPNSPQYMGILRGLITTLTRGRFWDHETGNILDAQIIGRAIEERNPVSSCDDIVAQLNLIATAVANLDISQDLQVAIQTNIQNNISVVATAIADSLATQSGLLVAASVSSASAQANAFAWSQALAQNLTPITVINNTVAQFRPIDILVDPPPTTAEETPTGITSVLEGTGSTEICERAYWLVRDLKEYLIYLDELNETAAHTVLGLSGLLTDALWAASFKADPLSRRFLVPAGVFLSVTHKLQQLLHEGFNPWAVLRSWIDDRYESLTCLVAEAMETEQSTEAIKEILTVSMSSDGVPAAYQFVPLVVFNYSSLAALYYVSPLLDVAPAIPAYEDPGICLFCLG